MTKLTALLAKVPADSQDMNARGNTIQRWHSDADRYTFDFRYCTEAEGWKQYDTSQDAWYFGVWVNVAERMTFTYCEGDWTLVSCPDDDHLRAELEDAARVYGEAPPMAIGIDGGGGVTKYYDTRPSV